MNSNYSVNFDKKRVDEVAEEKFNQLIRIVAEQVREEYYEDDEEILRFEASKIAFSILLEVLVPRVADTLNNLRQIMDFSEKDYIKINKKEWNDTRAYLIGLEQWVQNRIIQFKSNVQKELLEYK
jgi:hypothetical protein|tara:strand:- start:328 stop:702 length:375 start_codon:yes stop_codon:yes gene_type:complete